ncbi:MAG: cupin domain-containing protein [Acidimicrobiales bacterium]
MPAASKDVTPVSVEEEILEGRYAELGGYTVGFETYRADADPAPLFRGLPDDRRQCPHWGYVVSGKVVYRYADHEEVYEAGDAYYGAPGHLPLVFAGTELIEFSPTDALNRTMEVVTRNLQADQH